jgi:hypothetical protein
MPFIPLITLCAIILFVRKETIIHYKLIATWLSVLFFSILGMGIGMLAFSSVNFFLSMVSAHLETQRWHIFFGAISSLFGTFMIAVSIIMIRYLRKKLLLAKVAYGTVLLYVALCCLLGISAFIPQLNWW